MTTWRTADCLCGKAATEHLVIRWRSPRAHELPEAVDPWYVHGSGGIDTCGSPACEAEASLRLRDQILAWNDRPHRQNEYGYAMAGQVEMSVLHPDDATYSVACGDHVHVYTADELHDGVDKQCG